MHTFHWFLDQDPSIYCGREYAVLNSVQRLNASALHSMSPQLALDKSDFVLLHNDEYDTNGF